MKKIIVLIIILYSRIAYSQIENIQYFYSPTNLMGYSTEYAVHYKENIAYIKVSKKEIQNILPNLYIGEGTKFELENDKIQFLFDKEKSSFLINFNSTISYAEKLNFSQWCGICYCTIPIVNVTPNCRFIPLNITTIKCDGNLCEGTCMAAIVPCYSGSMGAEKLEQGGIILEASDVVFE